MFILFLYHLECLLKMPILIAASSFSLDDTIELDGYDSDFGQTANGMNALSNFEKEMFGADTAPAKKKARTAKEKKDNLILKKTAKQQSQASAAAPAKHANRPTSNVDHHATLDYMFSQLTKSSDILSSALNKSMPSKEDEKESKVQNKIIFLLKLKKEMPDMEAEINEKVKSLFKEL